MSLPTLADLKTFLNITSNNDDDELIGKLDAAITNVSKLLGPLEPVEVTEKHYGVSGSSLLLRQMPVVELTAVSVRSYGYASYGFAMTVPASLADYELDASAGVLRLANGGYFCGDYTVTYMAGRDELSYDIVEAILVIAAHLWNTQRGPVSAGPLAATDLDLGQVPGAGFAIPNRAAELLAPYRRPAIA